MAGLLTYSLKGAFPFYSPKPHYAEKEKFILYSGHPPSPRLRRVIVAKSA
jgi:hypothetical protein